jgi:chloramphenicol-sensitive protein RarD
VDASLGYFINPLVNIVFGVIFLKERLRTWQWVSVGLAFLGVLYLTLRLGTLPWIGLVLAFSFGVYGLLRKKVTERSIYGFAMETGFMFLPAFSYLSVLELSGKGNFTNQGLAGAFLLVTTGAYTAIPLIMFGMAAQLVQLSTLGFIQYITPTLQFLIGIFVYGEEFSVHKLVGFGLIWIALGIFSVEGIVRRKNLHR